MRCTGPVGANTTRQELIDRGLPPEAADELIAFRDRLEEKHGRAKSVCESCGYRTLPDRFLMQGRGGLEPARHLGEDRGLICPRCGSQEIDHPEKDRG